MFKIGDRVLVYGVIDGETFSGDTGYIGLITEERGCKSYLVVFDEERDNFHDGNIGKRNKCWWCLEENIFHESTFVRISEEKLKRFLSGFREDGDGGVL